MAKASNSQSAGETPASDNKTNTQPNDTGTPNAEELQKQNLADEAAAKEKAEADAKAAAQKEQDEKKAADVKAEEEKKLAEAEEARLKAEADEAEAKRLAEEEAEKSRLEQEQMQHAIEDPSAEARLANLASYLRGNPWVEKVYLNEQGEHHFHAIDGFEEFDSQDIINNY